VIEVCQDIYRAPHGNCFAACVASILEIDDLSEVPSYFGLGRWWTGGWAPWLEIQGVEWAWWWPTRDDGKPGKPDIAYNMDPVAVGGAIGDYWIGSGPGGRGVLHSVVYDAEGKMVWDPQPLAMQSGIEAIHDALSLRRAA
jgi:hypothetical protein